MCCVVFDGGCDCVCVCGLSFCLILWLLLGVWVVGGLVFGFAAGFGWFWVANVGLNLCVAVLGFGYLLVIFWVNWCGTVWCLLVVIL